MVAAGGCALALALALGGSGPAAVGDRAEFTDGSCLAHRPPEGPDHPKTVFVDAGHGGLDEGTHGTTPEGTRITEKQVALATAKQVKARLLERGYEVVMSRTKDSSVAVIPGNEVNGTTYSVRGDRRDIRARVDCANEADTDLLVSVHFNAFDDPSAGGATTYYDPDRGFAMRNERLARDIQDGIMAAYSRAGWTAIPDRGVVPDTSGSGAAVSAEARSYGHLYLLGPRLKGFNDEPSLMPGVLTEPLFLTDPPEAQIAASAHGRRGIATGIADGIDDYFHGA